ncbi:MAG: hypothetical protein ACXVJ7_09140 [Acidimicrobiia bacterium]
MSSNLPGGELRAGLHLLDHQILDCDGWMAGNVDDLELSEDRDGGPPIVTAILSGAGALARRLGGRAGRALEALDERLAAEQVPSRVPFELVADIDSHVTVTVRREALETDRGEAWVRRRVVDHIPGAHRAAE